MPQALKDRGTQQNRMKGRLWESGSKRLGKLETESQILELGQLGLKVKNSYMFDSFVSMLMTKLQFVRCYLNTLNSKSYWCGTLKVY